MILQGVWMFLFIKDSRRMLVLCFYSISMMGSGSHVNLFGRPLIRIIASRLESSEGQIRNEDMGMDYLIS